MNTNEQTWVSHAWLRRVCQRIPEVAPAHAGDPALEIQTPRLLQAAESFASETDALASVEANVDAAHAECVAKAKVVYDRMRIWFALLTRDMSEFVASAYAGTPVVVEDQISDGQALVRKVSEHRPALPYAERLIADVTAATDGLQAAYKAEQVLRTECVQQKERESKAAAVLNAELVAYRRMLRRAIGPTHLHYRMLTRRGRSEPEDDVGTPVTTEPAANGPPRSESGGSTTPAT
jgi:hypothetical protein